MDTETVSQPERYAQTSRLEIFHHLSVTEHVELAAEVKHIYIIVPIYDNIEVVNYHIRAGECFSRERKPSRSTSKFGYLSRNIVLYCTVLGSNFLSVGVR